MRLVVCKTWFYLYNTSIRVLYKQTIKKTNRRDQVLHLQNKTNHMILLQTFSTTFHFLRAFPMLMISSSVASQTIGQSPELMLYLYQLWRHIFTNDYVTAIAQSFGTPVWYPVSLFDIRWYSFCPIQNLLTRPKPIGHLFSTPRHRICNENSSHGLI